MIVRKSQGLFKSLMDVAYGKEHRFKYLPPIHKVNYPQQSDLAGQFTRKWYRWLRDGPYSD